MAYSKAIEGAKYYKKNFLTGRYTGVYEVKDSGDYQGVWYDVKDADGNIYQVEDLPEYQDAMVFHVEVTIPKTSIEEIICRVGRASHDNLGFDNILAYEVNALSNRLGGVGRVSHSKDIQGKIELTGINGDNGVKVEAAIDWNANRPKIGSYEDAPLMVPISEVLTHMPEELGNVDLLSLWADIEEIVCDRVAGAPKIMDEKIYFDDLPNPGTVVGMIEAIHGPLYTDKKTLTSWVETFYSLLGEYTGSVILVNK